MNNTQWLPVPNFPQYEISSDGKLRSWRRKSRVWRNPHSSTRERPIEINGTITPHGYTAFILRKQDSTHPYRVLAHRLVALAFIPNPYLLTDVAHNDGNPSNNRIENLRWSSHRDNQMDMRIHGTMQDGEKCVTRKLNKAEVNEIRRRAYLERRGSGKRLSIEFKVSTAQISRIVNRTRWTA